jgi:nitroreductase
MTAAPPAVAAPGPGLVAGLLERLLPEGAPPPAPFSGRPVEEEEELALLGGARVAPSADNAQTWRFVVVRSEERRADLARAVPPALAAAVRTAPLVVAVCGVPWLVKGVRREQPFVMIDVPIGITHLLLEAAELGITCAFTLEPDEGLVRGSLAIPAEVRVVALLALGWCL